MTEHKRINTQICTKPLLIHISDQLLAATQGAILLVENNYPVRYYIPRQDVDMSQLTLSLTQTFCPFKGQARYYSWQNHADVAWSYESPIAGRSDITGALCFANDAWLIWPEGMPELI